MGGALLLAADVRVMRRRAARRAVVVAPPRRGRPDVEREALDVERLALVPYETKATTAKSALGAELKPFFLPEPLVEQLAAGSRIVRVDTPPFSPGPTPVVRGFVGNG